METVGPIGSVSGDRSSLRILIDAYPGMFFDTYGDRSLIPMLSGPGNGRSPLRQLIAKILDEGRPVNVPGNAPDTYIELKRESDRLADILISFGARSDLDIEGYADAPLSLRFAHSFAADEMLALPVGEYRDGWNAGVRALYADGMPDRPERSGFVPWFETLEAAHPVFGSLLYAAKRLEPLQEHESLGSLEKAA